MAVRFDASGDYLRRTANLPADNSYTICGWARLVTDTNTYSTLCSIESATTSAAGFHLLSTDVDGTSLKVWNDGGAGTTIATLTAGTAFFWAMVADGRTAANIRGYYRADGSNALTTQNAGTAATAFTSAALYIANDSYTEPFSGRVWNVKVWDRALSASELLIESFYERPQYPTSLNCWWPLPNSSDTADRGPNARNPTVGGTLTTEDSTVALWRPSAQIIIPAAAGGVSGTSATTNAADTSSASGTTTVTGTVAYTNSADTSSAAGTTTVVGSSAATNAADTSSANGSVGSEVTGTSATTNANDTSSASGTTTVTGSSATTNADDTSSASGTTTIVGTSAGTNADDTSSASGTTTVVGASATTNADDTSTASGSSGSPVGTAAIVNANDAADARGTAETGFSGGWPMPPRKKRKKREEERPEPPQEDPAEPQEKPQQEPPQAPRLEAVVNRAIEQAAKDYAAEFIAAQRRQAEAADLQRAAIEQQMARQRRMREEEELVLMLLLKPSKRSKQPA